MLEKLKGYTPLWIGNDILPRAWPVGIARK
jgi:hypothetical protein